MRPGGAGFPGTVESRYYIFGIDNSDHRFCAARAAPSIFVSGGPRLQQSSSGSMDDTSQGASKAGRSGDVSYHSGSARGLELRPSTHQQPQQLRLLQGAGHTVVTGALASCLLLVFLCASHWLLAVASGTSCHYLHIAWRIPASLPGRECSALLVVVGPSHLPSVRRLMRCISLLQCPLHAGGEGGPPDLGRCDWRYQGHPDEAGRLSAWGCAGAGSRIPPAASAARLHQLGDTRKRITFSSSICSFILRSLQLLAVAAS